jgi:hypothetical protein
MPWRGADTLSRITKYLDQDLWMVDLSSHGVARRLVVRGLRVVVVVARAPTETQLNLQATALVYRSCFRSFPSSPWRFRCSRGSARSIASSRF